MSTIFIPLIKKDVNANDFTCRDGEIDLMLRVGEEGFEVETPSDPSDTKPSVPYFAPHLHLTPEGTFPTATIRIALEPGDADKARLLLGGEISRVDVATAERLTQQILEKGADALLSITTDLRRQGLFLLPFRVYTMTMAANGTSSYPSPQAIALPTDYPPHPEITASAVTSDSMTLALRFPVKPHRLIATAGPGMPTSQSIRTFISYPLYIPNPKEMKGSIGSVRSITGSSVAGIRFAFLSQSALKASVAAPEKYYELVGNSRTGFRISSKAAATPDYSVFAQYYGFTPAFPASTMMLSGDGVDQDTDVLDWIADWVKTADGYLPIQLPSIFRQPTENTDSSGDQSASEIMGPASFPNGIHMDCLLDLARQLSMKSLVLTRPMALAANNTTRRNSAPTAIRWIKVEGLPDSDVLAILYGSHDCRHWHPLRAFEPHKSRAILAPPRLWHRLAIMSQSDILSLPNAPALRLSIQQ